MEFVEQLGGYFESSGLTRLAGRLLGWLLVCTPERQSSEELAAALGASSGGISTNARTLIQLLYRAVGIRFGRANAEGNHGVRAVPAVF